MKQSDQLNSLLVIKYQFEVKRGFAYSKSPFLFQLTKKNQLIDQHCAV